MRLAAPQIEYWCGKPHPTSLLSLCVVWLVWGHVVAPGMALRNMSPLALVGPRSCEAVRVPLAACLPVLWAHMHWRTSRRWYPEVRPGRRPRGAGPYRVFGTLCTGASRLILRMPVAKLRQSNVDSTKTSNSGGKAVLPVVHTPIPLPSVALSCLSWALLPLFPIPARQHPPIYTHTALHYQPRNGPANP